MTRIVFTRFGPDYETPIAEGHLHLRDAFFAPWRLVQEGGIDPIIRGLLKSPAKLMSPKQVRKYAFTCISRYHFIGMANTLVVFYVTEIMD